MAWLIGGDFNEILYAHEKKGGNPSDFLSMKAFRDSLDCFSLTEVRPRGYLFTWCNGRTEGFIEERLDRAVGNPEWHDIFRDATSETIVRDSLDHYPICISLGQLQTPSTQSSLGRKKIFRFEAKWLQVDSFDRVIADLWGQSGTFGLSSWSAKVHHCGKLLLRWDHVTFKRTQWRIAWLKKRMKKLQHLSQWRVIVEESREVEKELRELRRLEETAAWQRSRPFVLRDTDKNTIFFHAKADSRVKRNNIKMLHDSSGNPQTSIETIRRVVMNFYRNLFSSSRGSISVGQLDMVDRRIDDSMAAELVMSYTREEVVRALKDMHPCKSPGPDGLPALFYKKYWDLLGEELCSLVLGFLNGGNMPADLNHTFVALIPKVREPTDMKDLRPISLCNVSYKFISKVLANRLKKILPVIISDNQSAFVPGRLFTDNVLLSSEVFHFMKHNQAKKQGYIWR